MKDKKINSEKLIELRISRGETKETVAKGTGITSRTLFNYESGRIKRPNENTVQKLADYYGVEISVLLCEED